MGVYDTNKSSALSKMYPAMLLIANARTALKRYIHDRGFHRLPYPPRSTTFKAPTSTHHHQHGIYKPLFLLHPVMIPLSHHGEFENGTREPSRQRVPRPASTWTSCATYITEIERFEVHQPIAREVPYVDHIRPTPLKKSESLNLQLPPAGM